MNRLVNSGLTLALTLCACGTAYAHAHLHQSAPAADAVGTAAPDILRLDFSEGIQLGFTGVTLHGPDGGIASGPAQLAPEDDNEVLVPLLRVLTKGKYTVEWHALSKDGHTTHGSYGFSVAN
jgi:copper resistance protein C